MRDYWTLGMGQVGEGYIDRVILVTCGILLQPESFCLSIRARIVLSFALQIQKTYHELALTRILGGSDPP
jgi:hypothetical protein